MRESLIFAKKIARERLLILAWAFYDLANQSFALNVVSLYFVRWVTIEKQTPELYYSVSFGISMFLVAFLAPFLGAISDLTNRHRLFLVSFTFLSVIFTILLGWARSVFLGLLFFAIANFGCQAAIIFYNSLLVNIAPQDKVGLVSGIGKMFGYCGAILALLVIRPLVIKEGYQAAFVPSGLLFFIFALPCMLFVRDKKSSQPPDILTFFRKDKLLFTSRQIFGSAFRLVKSAGLSDFLKATFFCLCVVNIIIIFMSVYVTRVFGLDENQIVNLIIFSTIFAIIGSVFSGYLSDHIGYKRSLIIVLLLWVICLFSGALARGMLSYCVIGPLVGVTLGSTWVVSRALAVHIVPAQKIGQVFGLFSFIGYLSAITGALFWGGLLWFLSPLGELGYRIALLSLLLLLLPAFVYVRRI